MTLLLILLPSSSIYCVSDTIMNLCGINQFTGRAGLQSDKDYTPDYKAMCCFLLKEAFKKNCTLWYIWFTFWYKFILLWTRNKICGLHFEKNLMNNYKEWRGVG